MLEKIHLVKCPNPPPEWYKDLWKFLDKNLVLPIGIAILTYLMTTFLGESRNRKNYSKLGVAIMDSLIEEVRNGLNRMESLQQFFQENPIPMGTGFGSLLPIKSWEGNVQTIPNEVLLRILAASEGITAPFPPNEIRIHCKNYFSHICENVNRAIENHEREQLIEMIGNGEGQGKYIESSNKVLTMLETIRDILQKNSQKLIPK